MHLQDERAYALSLEEGIIPPILGRYTFLKMLGATLAAFSMKIFAPSAAQAQIPTECTGHGARCACCTSFAGCGTPCVCIISPACTPTVNCWFACVNCRLVRCCDYIVDDVPCFCSSQIGNVNCCPA